ncbi:endonuclease/exonuclease/phosphatase family protein [Hyalangium gracile]|uniref:endonuclease/exonuclease/phosphatase family protein n=1 Tax=Hyalangium gracile TaxID=394092 RepID=UPI001CCB1282|nr:endonuclease/exonuclease/phosphatase family protein [Hyalangium gracile]
MTRVETPAPREPGELRVMTFNIESGVRGLDGVADVIRDARPDIVALQEVDLGSSRAGGLNQTAVLAERTGLPYHAHFRTTDLHGGAYGIALLSRFPLEALAQYPLPVPRGAEPRTVAHAVMQVAGREVSVYLTHLIRRPFNGAARVRQSALIAAMLEKDPRPKLLMGDLNDDPDSRPVRLLRRGLTDVVAASGQGTEGTYPLPLPFSPVLRIDYVLACDAFVPLRSAVLRVGASDHYPVIADVLLKPAPEPQLMTGAAP